MKHRHLVTPALLFSFFLHLVFLATARYVWMSGAADLLQDTEKLFNVQTLEAPEMIRARQEFVQDYVEKLKFQAPVHEMKKMKAAELKAEAPEEIDMQPLPDLEPEKIDTKPDNAPVEDIGTRKDAVEVQRRKVNKNTVKEIDLSKAWEELTRQPEGEIQVPKEFSESMMAFTPDFSPAPSRASAPRPAAGSIFSGTGIERETEYESLDRFLHVKVRIYRDPEDGQGYYQIVILPGRDVETLDVLPKEIVFLVDASLSIHRDRLRAFRRGIEYCLKNLNPEDRFNIYTFKDEIASFQPESIKATGAHIVYALKYLDDLYASQRTDLYRAFRQSVEEKAALPASYLLLFSDGRPNTGVTSPVKIISEITAMNDGRHSIFTLSGGKRVNRFLLDFMAYQNRGWSEYSSDTRDIPETIEALYDKIRNPILLNLRFQIQGLDSESIYPKHLPDFYRDTAFMLYGTFRNESDFSMRVLGDVNEETREFIFSRNLARVESGTREIARHWALNKIYHLMSLMTTEGYSEDRIREIRRLSQKFDLQTPYRF